LYLNLNYDLNKISFYLFQRILLLFFQTVVTFLSFLVVVVVVVVGVVFVVEIVVGIAVGIVGNVVVLVVVLVVIVLVDAAAVFVGVDIVIP